MKNILRQFVTICALLLAAAASNNLQAADALERVNDFQVLTVGTSGNQPPLSMINEDGQPMGFDIDLARALAKAMNVKLELRIMPFGELLDALEKDEVDMVLSGLSITPDRTERVSFVGPYMMSGKSILTKRSSMERVGTIESISSGDVKLLALRNSTSASFVRRVAPDANLVEIESYDAGVAALMEDKADAMVADVPMCILAVLRYPEAEFTTLEKPLTVEPIGIALARDDPQFKNLVENYLTAFEKTGLLNEMRKQWFEESEWLAQLR